MIISTIGDKDYDSLPYTLKFNAGVTQVPLNISIFDDNILETDETFILIVNISSLPNNIIVGHYGKATVTIEDDDRE